MYYQGGQTDAGSSQKHFLPFRVLLNVGSKFFTKTFFFALFRKKFRLPAKLSKWADLFFELCKEVNITAAMLMERTIVTKSFGNLRYIFLLFWHQYGRLITWVQSKNAQNDKEQPKKKKKKSVKTWQLKKRYGFLMTGTSLQIATFGSMSKSQPSHCKSSAIQLWSTQFLKSIKRTSFLWHIAKF